MKNSIITSISALTIRLYLIFLLLSSTIFAETMADNNHLDTVTLQLKWRHQFQFAGYYAALEKGFYKEAGLVVKIIENTGEDASKNVLEGRAEFGIAMSDLILLRSEGYNVVALAAIYQHSPLVILVPKKTGIDNLHALSGKRIMIESHSGELFAYFKYENLPQSKMIIYPHSFDTSDLINNKVDAMSAYSTDEPYMLIEKNIDYHIFSPRSGGIDFYGDILYTVEDQVKNHPKRVDAFINASLKGWDYALKNSEEIIDLILLKYSKRHSRDHLLFEAKKTKQLIMPNVVEIGYMNPGRWGYIAEVYANMKMIQKNFSLDGFLYDKNKGNNHIVLYISLIITVIISIIAFLIAFYFIKLNKNLKNEIQKRKKSDDKLKEKEREITTLMKNIPGMAYRCCNNKKWTMLFVSDHCFELTGYTSSQLCNDSEFSFGDLIIPEDRNMVYNKVQDAINEKKSFKLNYRIIDKSGQKKWLWEQGTGVYNDDGNLIALEGLINDITDYKLALEKIENAKKIAETANQSKNAFLANMSHEIRSPISGIIGMIKMMIEITDEKKILDNLNIVLETANSLSIIIDDILDLSKIEDKKLEMQNIDFTLSDLLNQVIKIYSYALDNKGLKLELSVNENVYNDLNGDPNRLKQILRNLISNAIKFTEHGTIKINVKRINNDVKHIELLFIVTDTGIGIPEDKIPFLFERFTQLDNTYSKKYAGTGLGLTITKELVELMGGKIWLESTQGKGTSFFFTVFFKKAKKTINVDYDNSHLKSNEISNRDINKKSDQIKIILAEDDELNRKSINFFLKKAGYCIFLAENGKQVLEILRKQDVNLIIMDIQMPVMDGFQATAIIRDSTSDVFNANIPIIAFTAYAMKGDKEKMIKAGMTDYISKPVKIPELISKIKKLL